MGVVALGQDPGRRVGVWFIFVSAVVGLRVRERKSERERMRGRETKKKKKMKKFFSLVQEERD